MNQKKVKNGLKVLTTVSLGRNYLLFAWKQIVELGGAPLLGTTWPPYGDKLVWATLSHYLGTTRGPLRDTG